LVGVSVSVGVFVGVIEIEGVTVGVIVFVGVTVGVIAIVGVGVGKLALIIYLVSESFTMPAELRTIKSYCPVADSPCTLMTISFGF
jgi:hypothetical protein